MENRSNMVFPEFVYEFYRSMKDHEISLVYEGEITHQITKAFTSLAEANMGKDKESTTVQRKVFHVMVECLQNISKHAEDLGDYYSNDGRGIFMVHKGKEEYRITTGNLIDNEKVEEISSFLEKINAMTKVELDELHKTQIREGRLSDKKGAGLGFIDMARKTGEKLEYQFLKMNEQSSFFILITRVSRNI
jgi:hypothetical protein